MEVPSPGGRNCCEGVCTSSHANRPAPAGRDRDRATPGFQVTGSRAESGLGDTLGEGGHMRPGGSAGVGRRSPGQGDGAEASQEGHVGPAHWGLEQKSGCFQSSALLRA